MSRLACLSLSCRIFASLFLSGGDRYFCVSNFFSSSMVWSFENRTWPPLRLWRGRWINGVHIRGLPEQHNKAHALKKQAIENIFLKYNTYRWWNRSHGCFCLRSFVIDGKCVWFVDGMSLEVSVWLSVSIHIRWKFDFMSRRTMAKFPSMCFLLVNLVNGSNIRPIHSQNT